MNLLIAASHPILHMDKHGDIRIAGYGWVLLVLICAASFCAFIAAVNTSGR